MGLSSSQARLLNLTARMHQIEYGAQRVEAMKLQMANESRRVYEDYLDALDKTKIQVKTLTTNGAVTFNDLTSYEQLLEAGFALVVHGLPSDFTFGGGGRINSPRPTSVGSFGSYTTNFAGAVPDNTVTNVAGTQAIADPTALSINPDIPGSTGSGDTVTNGTDPTPTVIPAGYSGASGLAGTSLSGKTYSDLTGSAIFVDPSALSGSEPLSGDTGSGGSDPSDPSDPTNPGISGGTLTDRTSGLTGTPISIDPSALSGPTAYSIDPPTFSGDDLPGRTVIRPDDALSFVNGGTLNPGSLPSGFTPSGTTPTRGDTPPSGTGGTTPPSDPPEIGMSQGSSVICRTADQLIEAIKALFTDKDGNPLDISSAMYNNFETLLTNLLNSGSITIIEKPQGADDFPEIGTLEFADYETSVATNTKLQEVADEVEIRKAEAKYEADMKRIDMKDRRYDSDLAALDNERNAVKLEMETLKTVAKDNVDRTFRLFS